MLDAEVTGHIEKRYRHQRQVRHYAGLCPDKTVTDSIRCLEDDHRARMTKKVEMEFEALNRV
jgi:hypothetical protein